MWHANADPRLDWPGSAAGSGRAPDGSCITAAQSAGFGGKMQVVRDPVHALTYFEVGYALTHARRTLKLVMRSQRCI